MWGSAVAGIIFLVLAWVTKKHHPNIRRVNWDWVHAALMLLAGVGLGPLVAEGFSWAFNLFTTFWDQKVTVIRGMPDWLNTVVTDIPQAVPWSLGAAVVLIVSFHMAPKIGRGIHGSTPWLAFIAPAAVLFFPPLFSLVKGG